MEDLKEEKRFIPLMSAKAALKLPQIIFVALSLVLVFCGSARTAQAADLYLSPSSGSYEINKTFSVGVFVSSAGQSMNAAGGTISFPVDKLEIISLSKSGSIFSLWVQEPDFSNSAGTINFEGIVMNPGFTGAGGKIITINFKTKAEGQAALNFSSGSILANDGAGTNILASLGSAQFNITVPASEEPAPAAKEPETEKTAPEETPLSTEEKNTPPAPKVSSPTHPDQEKWYSNNNPEFEFSLPKGVSGVNVLADRNSNTDPGIRSDGLFSSYTYENVDNGVWYFHVRLRNGYGWGETSHFRFQIDTEPPAPFAIEFIDGKEISQPRVNITFNTIDVLSGIDYYAIEHKDKDLLKISANVVVPHNPYTLPPLPLGEQQIKVIAFDKAGNSTSAVDKFIIKPVTPPEITDYPRRLAVGETLTVVGKTIYFNSGVIIWLQKDKAEPEKHLSQSDKEGKFTFNEKELGEGVYQLWAVAVDITVKEGDRQSNPSEKLTITVKEPVFKGFGDWLNNAGVWAIKFLTILIPLLALLFLLLLLLWYGRQKFLKLRLKAAKEIRLARKAFQKEIEKSKKDIKKRIEILEANRARRGFIDDLEKNIMERLKNELDNMEKSEKKEIKDVETIIK